MRYRFVCMGMLLFAFSFAFAQSPPAPANLTATFEIPSPNSLGNVKLQWQMPSAGLWLFRVFRSAHDTSHFQTIASGVHDHVFRDFSIVRGTRYFYYVRAYSQNNPHVLGPPSNVAEILVPLPAPFVRGFINGTVTDDSTTFPIRHARIRFFRLANIITMPPVIALTDSLGRYHAALDTGRYIIRAEVMCASNTSCYYPEYFDNVREPSQATVVQVGDSTTFTADFGLTRVAPPQFAMMRGTVTDTVGTPLPRARVAVLRTMQNMISNAANGGAPGAEESMTLDGVGFTMGVVWSGYTDSLGRYAAHVIAGRSYLAMSSKPGYWPEYFDNKPTPQLADIINLAGDTTGIDFSLSVRPIPQNSVAGRVVDSAGNGVPSRIYLYPARIPQPSVVPTRYGHTDSLGNYIISNVHAGKYFVGAYPFHGFAPAYFKTNACGVNRRDQADTVEVAGNITNINICVRQIHSNGLARITGTVRTNASAPLRGTTVVAQTELGVPAGIGVSEASGAYVIEAVPSGTMTITADREGYNVATTTVFLQPTILTVENVNLTMTPSVLTGIGTGREFPAAFALQQNFPNPFNPTTRIEFHLASAAMTTLEVYNMLGQKVATLVQDVLQPGKHAFTFDAANLASAVYFYKLQSGSSVATRKMLLMR
jgi:hypothetical protein